MPKVYHMYDPQAHRPVVVDRRTVWGNPFRPKNPSLQERNRVCDEFERYAIKKHQEDPTWLAPLKGRNLVCWCAPKRCHADTLLRLANDLGLEQGLIDYLTDYL